MMREGIFYVQERTDREGAVSYTHLDVYKRQELCVCDMAQLLGLSQTAVSHQLRVLRANKLVRFRREGKIVFYSLADEHVRRIIGQGMEHICE